MTVLMRGKEVADAMKELLCLRVQQLKEKEIAPCLAIVRVGERAGDLSYEKSAKLKMESLGISCRVAALPESVLQEQLEETIAMLNEDKNVHGILMLRPLPKHLNEEAIQLLIHPGKDVDCMSLMNIARVMEGTESGHAPCTPEAVMAMLAHYKIDLTGKKVALIGRSMVVGKPLTMMLLKENATVTICHTKTKNLAEICRESDLVIVAVGKARMLTEEMITEDTIVVDVGINVDETGKLCGDVDFEQVQAKASYISPVPGGVGNITTSILAEHVIRAAEQN